MRFTRRQVLQQTVAASFSAGLFATRQSLAVDRQDKERTLPLIIDTHQHLWDLERFRLPWLSGAPDVLRHSFRTKEYLQATEGFNVQTVYMEVDVDPQQHVAEMEYVVSLCASDQHPTAAAVVGGRPAAEDFVGYVKRLKQNPAVKGVRQVLHGDTTPAEFCLTEAFVRGIRLLGEHDLSFDLCMRPGELNDGVELAKRCPETRFIVDHCGNADPKAFGKKTSSETASHAADPWRRSIEMLAQQPNVICKISGIVARAPIGWLAEDLAPIVNHCLGAFGPNRVVFGGDWPVCLLGAKLRAWIDALAVIIADRPTVEQNKLWHANAQRYYGLSA